MRQFAFCSCALHEHDLFGACAFRFIFVENPCWQDMFEHQVNHRERITNHLKRGWRDYIIAEVLDKLSDDYNFFSDDLEKHMQSPLHALLRKLVSWQKTKESYHLVG